ncbi:TonB-dependent receptor [Sphingomonas sp. DBB INV C78]
MTGQPNQAGTDKLEEIVVTARRQNEALQDTPLSVTALGTATLERHNVANLEAIGDIVPNLDIAVTAGSTTAANIYIRGIGTYDYQIYTDPPISIYIDGVLIARPGAALFDLVDLERVEILRGPQGTLFGRNTTGGAINMTTQAPLDRASFRQRVGYGTDDEFTFRTAIDSGEIGSSGLYAKLAYSHRQRDGYVRNLNRGGSRDPGWLDSDAIWASLRGDLADNLSFQLNLDYSDYRAQQPLSQIVAADDDVITYFSNSEALGGDPFQFGTGRVKRAFAGYQPADHSEFFGTSLKVDYDVSDDILIRNITGFRSNSINEHSNLGGQGRLKGIVLDPGSGTTSVGDVTPWTLPHNDTSDDQFTNELQLIGKSGDLSYTLGLFYLESDGSLINTNLFTFVLPGGTIGINQNLTRRFKLKTRSYAGYGQVTYKPGSMDERLELSAGIRYTSDKKRIKENTTFNEIPTNVREASDSWDNVSGLGSISYKWTPYLLTYLRVSTAYRAGGFVPNTVGSYDPEKAIAYEAGIKSEWLDSRVRFNASIFRTNYKDLQIQNTIQGLPVVTNAGRAVYQGTEAELTVMPVRDLQLQASIGYVDPKYKSYLFVDPVTGDSIDLSDEAKFNGVSKVNAAAGFQYSTMISDVGLLTFSMDYSYRSKKYWFPLTRLTPYNPDVAAGASNNLAARLALSDVEVSGVKLGFELWVDNITDELVRAAGLDFGSFGTVVYERGRTVGLNVRAEF